MQDVGGTRKNPQEQEQWKAMEKTIGNNEKRGGYAALGDGTMIALPRGSENPEEQRRGGSRTNPRLGFQPSPIWR
jgi:hypothetical protein